MADFPTSVVSPVNPTSSNTLANVDHAAQHQSHNGEIVAIETKLGTGASTPSSGTVLRGTGAGTTAYGQVVPSTDIANLADGVATFLGTPSSANLRTVLTDETGTGAAVFATTPTLVTPQVDTINESTAANGVTVDGLNIKDGKVNTAGALSPVYTVNPYKFRAYLTAAFSTSSATFVKLPFDTENFDTSSNFDITTNIGRFTAPIAGFYQFNARYYSATSGGFVIITLYKNGVRTSDGNVQFYTSTSGIGVGHSDMLQLAANDYIEVYCYTDGVRVVETGSFKTYFSGFLVSAT